MGVQFLYPRLPHLQFIPVNFSGAGVNEIVAAVNTKRILVHRIFVVCAAATNLTFKRGTTALSGPIPMAANGGITLDITGEPWFTTDPAEAFNIDSSAGVQISGTCYYDTK